MEINFSDLHLHSSYSNLDGFGLPSQIVKRAKEIGRSSIALTDHGSVSGFVQLYKACKEQGIKPIYGYEAYIVPSLVQMYENKERTKNHITILASNLNGYKNVLKLASLAYKEGFYYRPTIDSELLFNHSDGLIVLSGCWSGFVQRALQNNDLDGAKRIADSFKSVFGDRYFLETQHFPLFKDTIAGLEYISKELEIPIVLTCDPHYLKDGQEDIQEIIHAVRDRRKFDASKIIHGAYQWPAKDLFSVVQDIAPDFNWKKAFETVSNIAEQCDVEIPKGTAPRFPLDKGKNAFETLLQMAREGVEHRGLGNAGEIYKQRFNEELKLIRAKDFADYFLIVADMVNWAKSQGVFTGPARGSSAGSLICYLLGITEIDPIKHNLLFIRFLDYTRFDLPDIDIDFEDNRREEVKRYLVNKYGEDKVCNVATFARFRGRNSLDEVGKMFDVPKPFVDEIKKFLIQRSGGDMRSQLTIQDTFEMSPKIKEIVATYPMIKHAISLEGQLRHMSMHAAGVIIGAQPLDTLIALYQREETGSDEHHTIGSVEMKDAYDLGLIKIDVLGLTELSILSIAMKQVGLGLKDLYALSLEDEETLKGFRELDTGGIFQFDGDSTRSVLRQIPNLNDFEYLVACVALSKPGPSHSGGATSYLARARGDKSKGFDWTPDLKEITKDTYGQIIYQEQVLAICKQIGRMPWTDANKIRNFISKSQGEEAFETYWTSFEKGALESGLSDKQAREIWEGMKTFGRWAFNRSHSVSYAMLAFWCMYIKRHYPLQFYYARLVKEKDEDKRRRLLMEINARGIPILNPKLGKSNIRWTIDEKSLRAGLIEIKGIGEKTAAKLIEKKYLTEDDFLNKKERGITKRTFEVLKNASAFSDNEQMPNDYFGLHKFDILQKIAPDREKLLDIKDWAAQYDIKVAGFFKEMNYKDIFEERRSRGHRTDNIKNPEMSKYAMLLLEDESDRCLVNIDRYLFSRIGDKIWDAYNNGYCVTIEGIKVGGWRIVRAKSVKVHDLKQNVTNKFSVERSF